MGAGQDGEDAYVSYYAVQKKKDKVKNGTDVTTNKGQSKSLTCLVGKSQVVLPFGKCQSCQASTQLSIGMPDGAKAVGGKWWRIMYSQLTVNGH